MRELWVNIAHTSGAKIYSLLVGIVTLSLTDRLLGPEGRGQNLGKKYLIRHERQGQRFVYDSRGEPYQRREGNLQAAVF
ncbi:MAG: hypothetical protein NTX45_22825 [Proteobacteria bacterium]|nr:hypothetical protein [Pseudomonadota bacterium]